MLSLVLKLVFFFFIFMSKPIVIKFQDIAYIYTLGATCAGCHVAFVHAVWEQNVLFLPSRLQATCTSKWHATYMDVSMC